ncbi:MAG: tRNA (guanosine(37)-N1)-methyltransferase TrmD [Candidatus Marinimicrobia bacterium]|nr:tRNA (guanosine(37)-N1)-methyltransferase TrmD [Candidatus Neomarinimicrobiota bacterium]
MKQIGVITPVPSVVDTLIENSMLRQAVNREKVHFHVVNLRDFTEGNYRQVDDTPFGGGHGMVMMAEPLFKAIDHLKKEMDFPVNGRIVYPSAQGVQWSHDLAEEYSKIKKLIFICGHYKGIDERVITRDVTHEYTVGDYIMSCGELPAMVMIDSLVRLIPGVLNSSESAESDSFPTGLLDAPYYTKPREVEEMTVPDVLLSGHHSKIDNWRQIERENRTRERRPDLWKKYLKQCEDSEKES